MTGSFLASHLRRLEVGVAMANYLFTRRTTSGFWFWVLELCSDIALPLANDQRFLTND
jgi:hypothetical protein